MRTLLTSFVLLPAALLPAVVGAAEPVTIRYACAAGGDGLRQLEESVQAFEKVHPNIRVKIEPIVDNYENKLLSMLAARVQPDVANMNPNRFMTFASRDALLPLNSFPDIDSKEVDLKGRYPNSLTAFSNGGKLYALPRDIASSAYIYYNRRIFREAGIPEPDGTWTWDTKVRPELKEKDFFWVVSTLTKRVPGRKRPVRFGMSTAWPQLWMDTLLMSAGVRMWDSDEDPTRLFLDDPQVERIFRFASDTINEQRWLPSFNDVTLGAGSTMQDEFRKGNLAMLQSGTWEIKDMRAKMRDEWDIAPFPRYAGAGSGGGKDVPGEGNGLGIFAGTKYPKEAWEWVKWCCGREELIRMARSGESQPSIRELTLTPGVWLPAEGATGPAANPRNLAISDGMALRVKNRQLPDWFQGGVANDLQGNYFAVLSGEKTAKEVLSDLQRDLPPKLELARRRVDAPDYPFGVGVGIAVVLVSALLVWIYLPERKRRYTRTEKEESRSAYLFLIPWLCGLAMTVGPMIYSFLLSFAESDIIRTPKWRGIGNYADALNPRVDDTMYVSLRQTFLFAGLSVPLGIAAALGLAVLLNQKVRGVPLYRALYYLPSLASAVAMSLIWMRLFDRDQGVINALLYGADDKGGLLPFGPMLSNLVGTPGERINWLGNVKTVIPAFVIMGLWGAGGGTIIFLAGLQGIPESYREAALLDGATSWRRFRHVTLPLLTPYVFFSFITGVIGALQVFGQSFVLTAGGPDRATLFTVVLLYQKAFGELKMGYASALAWILFVVIMVFTMIQLWASKRWVHYEGELK